MRDNHIELKPLSWLEGVILHLRVLQEIERIPLQRGHVDVCPLRFCLSVPWRSRTWLWSCIQYLIRSEKIEILTVELVVNVQGSWRSV